MKSFLRRSRSIVTEFTVKPATSHMICFRTCHTSIHGEKGHGRGVLRRPRGSLSTPGNPLPSELQLRVGAAAWRLPVQLCNKQLCLMVARLQRPSLLRRRRACCVGALPTQASPAAFEQVPKWGSSSESIQPCVVKAARRPDQLQRAVEQLVETGPHGCP